MSSSMKKRKHFLDDSEDEELLEPNIFSKNEKLKESKHSQSSKKKKRAVISDESDEDSEKEQQKRPSKKTNDKDGEVVEDSINDIKKKAKARAKRLAAGLDDPEPPAAKSSSKTPPSKQKNNILNYFRPLSSQSSDKKVTSSNENNVPDDQKNGSIEKNKSTMDKMIKKKDDDDDDEYRYTFVKKDKSLDYHHGSSSEKKSLEIEKKSSLKTEETTLYTKIKTEHKESPRKNNKLDNEEKTFKEEENNEIFEKNRKHRNETTSSKDSPRKSQPPKENKNSPLKRKIDDSQIFNKEKIKSPLKKPMIKPKQEQQTCEPRIVETVRVSDLWVDKYKPNNIKQVIGQQGDRSAMNKLLKWLRFWHENLDKKPGFGKWASEDGAGFRAAMLSGPPGIGKTTTAQLVCKELGYDYLELNASDTRNKKSLHENVGELLKNTKLTEFFKSDQSKEKDKKLTTKHCLIMDEVDGASGNEDRGGVAELIQLIKTTKIPIICICNDRGNQKIRSLVNYCFDLRFPKPKLEQIRASLMSIAFKENVKYSQDALNDLIASSNYDIRQCIHNFYLLATNNEHRVNKMINPNEKPIKDVRLTPFEAIKKVFSTGQEYALMSFTDKSDLFFCDYGIMPLFVYENYSSINLSSKEKSVAKQLQCLDKAIDAISFGDLIEKEIRRNQAWSLLPMQAAFSTVMPGSYMRSQNGLGFPQFPQFMGKLSTTNKNNRIVEELLSHMKLSISGSKSSLILDYIQPMRHGILDSLTNLGMSGLSSVMDLLEYYSLTKEDMDSLLEYCLWAGDDDPMKKIDSKTKAALTRAYNKKDFALPYSRDSDFKLISKGKTSKKKGKRSKQPWEESDDSESQDDPDDDFNDLDYY